MRDLRVVCNFETTKAMPTAQIDARAKPLLRASHATACIFHIAKTPERCRLQVRVPGLARKLETSSMLPKTAIDVAAGEAEIATQEMDPRPLGDQSMSNRGCLGPL